MNSSATHQVSRPGGFTLIEVLVACSILALLVVIVAQMVGSASSLSSNSKKRLDADDEARMVFDRITGDINGMLKRRDVNPLFLPNAGNDAFFFYSQAPAYLSNSSASNSQIAIIGYFMTNSASTNGLVRLGSGQAWDSLSFTNSMGAAVTAASINPTNLHLIAPDVFRMEYALLMKPGSTNNTNGQGPVSAITLGASSSSASTNGPNVVFQTNNAGQGMKDVAGIIVAIAILDPTSRVIVSSNALATLASNSMSDASLSPSNSSGLINGAASNGIPMDDWRTNALISPNIPSAARGQIRIYQRYIPINQ
jgi:prepilin-type N-terminal cleavage/methylation domain-containing protein